jgi:hypothetical protein
MNTRNELLIMRMLGRIEGTLEGMQSLSVRVSYLERWLAWLKGGWVAMCAACGYLGRQAFAR